MRLFFLLLAARALSEQQKEVYIACSRDGDLALTYDQGPATFTGKLLNHLARHKAKATFHVTPDYLDNPVLLAYLKRAANDGHLIGLYVKETAIKEKTEDTMSYIESGRKLIAKHINYAPVYLRFPIGAASDDLLKQVWARGMTVTSYNLDSQDYLFANDTAPDPRQGAVYSIFKSTLDAIEPPAKGSFIAIQRDLVGPSVEQSDVIIEYALKKGYRLVRLDECLSRGVDSGSGLDGKETPTIPQVANSASHSLPPKCPTWVGVMVVALNAVLF